MHPPPVSSSRLLFIELSSLSLSLRSLIATTSSTHKSLTMSRVALQSLVRSRSIALSAPVRSFHRSSIVLASEVPSNPFGNSEKVQEFTEKVKAAPAVIAAIGTLTKLMVAKGAYNDPRQLSAARRVLIRIGIRHPRDRSTECCQHGQIGIRQRGSCRYAKGQ
jgi:hypothetical protein